MPEALPDDLQASIQSAVAAGIRDGVGLVRSAVSAAALPVAPAVTVKAAKHPSPIAVIGIAVALVVPGSGWILSLSNRVSVLEAKATNLEHSSEEIAALKQEVTDFRSEFREWKRDNQNRSMIAATAAASARGDK